VACLKERRFVTAEFTASGGREAAAP